ncbi:hypothetical protein A7E78_06360 [Syntrophotalea acetylenivorans]|uniref:Porin domain-containing protein n=1 Tax=Syntrophotalea acetylenivorans TaxID=1842532 RepID=A0A1L3GNJ1_9BACT|nr:histidine kinase [Syntrophotalea acetylenivorans]APG27497.1 hypothetical protein A7E78_06360 [Syntrophotalea acetylenivorans]
MKSIKQLFYSLAIFATLFVVCPAQAALVIGGSDGWSFSTDGNVNMFLRYATADERPDKVHSEFHTLSDDQESFRLRSGFLPGVLAFNVKAPTMGGLDMGSRVGFYPNPQNANKKNSFSGQIDLREVFFTVDGNFGQFMVGKSLSLFMGQNALTGWTLMGYGIEGSVAGGGATLGNIGYGYIYPQFNAQVRYTTPDMNGFKLALALHDPSVINGSGVSTGVDGVTGEYIVVKPSATETKMPRIEGELTYAGNYADGAGSFKSWISGLYQEAEFNDGSDIDDVTAWGVAGGVQVGYKGYEVVVSGFDGEGLGSTLMLDFDSLDYTGEEREGYGYLLQGTYTFANGGKTKLAICYGANRMEETSAEKAARAITEFGELKQQDVITLGVSHDINPHLKLVAEYNHANVEWFNGGDQSVDIIAVGTFFLW